MMFTGLVQVAWEWVLCQNIVSIRLILISLHFSLYIKVQKKEFTISSCISAFQI